jgi:hypothetical protein
MAETKVMQSILMSVQNREKSEDYIGLDQVDGRVAAVYRGILCIKYHYFLLVQMKTVMAIVPVM